MQDQRAVQLFDGLTSSQLERAMTHVRISHIQRGEYIFLTGESVDYLFLIERGIVKISYITADGNEQVIDFRGNGSIFGELFLGRYRHRIGIAQALTNSTIYKLSEQCFYDLSQCYPLINRNFIKHLVNSHRESLARLHAVSRADARLRILGLLTILARQFNSSELTIFRLHPSITQEDLANMAGLNRSTVSSLINECRRDGLLSGSRRDVFVHLPEIEALLSRNGSEILV